MSPYRLVYGKSCYLLVEIEHKAYWATQKINENLNEVGLNRKLRIMELEEIRNEANENAKISKMKMKRLHDNHISRKSLHVVQHVLLYDSRLHVFLGKLKSRWTGPFMVRSISSHGVCDIENLQTGQVFKVNGHHLKAYYKFPPKKELNVDLTDQLLEK